MDMRETVRKSRGAACSEPRTSAGRPVGGITASASNTLAAARSPQEMQVFVILQHVEAVFDVSRYDARWCVRPACQ